MTANIPTTSSTLGSSVESTCTNMSCVYSTSLVTRATRSPTRCELWNASDSRWRRPSTADAQVVGDVQAGTAQQPGGVVVDDRRTARRARRAPPTASAMRRSASLGGARRRPVAGHRRRPTCSGQGWARLTDHRDEREQPAESRAAPVRPDERRKRETARIIATATFGQRREARRGVVGAVEVDAGGGERAGLEQAWALAAARPPRRPAPPRRRRRRARGPPAATLGSPARAAGCGGARAPGGRRRRGTRTSSCSPPSARCSRRGRTDRRSRARRAPAAPGRRSAGVASRARRSGRRRRVRAGDEHGVEPAAGARRASTPSRNTASPSPPPPAVTTSRLGSRSTAASPLDDPAAVLGAHRQAVLELVVAQRRRCRTRGRRRSASATPAHPSPASSSATFDGSSRMSREPEHERGARSEPPGRARAAARRRRRTDGGRRRRRRVRIVATASSKHRGAARDRLLEARARRCGRRRPSP